MKRRRLQPTDYTVGWICALPIELAAAQEMLDEEDESLPQDVLDPNLYTLGRIDNHNVVLTSLPAGQTGTQSAATVASRMTSKFTLIRFGLMVGIGGGVPSAESDIRLGDVVISQPCLQYGGVVQYDFGKTKAGGHKTRTGWLNAPPTVLLNAVLKLQALHLRGRSNLTTYLSAFDRLENFSRYIAGPDVLFEETYSHIRGATCKRCSKVKEVKRTPRKGQDVVIHCGTIASGNQVIKDGITRNRLSAELGGVMCFEMEAAGLMNAFPCLVIRGICDYADSHKNKKWQPYAAATAAACAKEILSVIPASEVATTRTINEATIYEMLRFVIDNLSEVPMLSGLDQDEHISTIPQLDRDHPMFCWIFRNMDFKQWNSAKCSQVLCLFGLPECNINQISSYIVGQEKNNALTTDHFVLYFFCSSAIRRKSIVSDFVYTLLQQIVCCSQMERRVLIIRNFLYSLVEEAFKQDASPNWKERGFNQEDHPDTIIPKILNALENDLWAALRTVLSDEEQRDLSLVVDGLDKVEYQRDHFINGVRVFLNHLQQRTSKIRILLTSRPHTDFKEVFNGLPCIEYDRERKECLASLRFDNTRYNNISPEYNGSFEWIWAHNEYKNWSTPDMSRLLYIQGKPGSGKSTITKYFSDHLLEQDTATKSAIVARFFYSYREGVLQRSHYNMLRSILYDILQQDETFFYHRFQTEYRTRRCRVLRADWDYASLKEVLKSLKDYSPAKRVYLIIDAVDESDDKDRHDILTLLFDLCSETKYLKIFVASRPVGELELRKSKVHNFIRLQDETKSDIYTFARSFLKGLNPSLLTGATEYIVENAQGVFLWVKLVGDELLASAREGYAEEDAIEFLKSLPNELEDFYTLMFERMKSNHRDLQNLRNLRNPQHLRDLLNLRDGVKMLRFVLWARRPLIVDELLHALGIPDDPNTRFPLSDGSFGRVPSEERIIHCGGNFIEIKPCGNRTVQVIHQTVREFFLNPDGCVANSEYRTCEKDAHVCISITCIRSLMLYSANTALVGTLPHVEFWTLEHFERYAQYIDKNPLANYALCHLTHHINHCHRDANVLGITSQFINELTDNSTIYLLESWVSSSMNETLLGNDEVAAAKEFRNKVLHAAVWNGFSTASEILLTVGINVNARDQEGRPPLSRAAEKGHEAVVRLLLERSDVEIDSKDGDGKTPLSWAAWNGNEAVVRLLVDQPDVNADSKDKSGRTPLSRAAEKGHGTVVRLLLERSDVETDSKDGDGKTPLSWAAWNGNEAVVRLLVDRRGVNADSKDKSGRTPLSLAAGKGHRAVIRLLLERRDVEADSKDVVGKTPLWWASEGAHDATVEVLLTRKDVEINLKDNYSRTVLLRAAGKGHEAVVRLLLTRSDVEADPKDDDGQTPLSWAAEGGHEAVVRLLADRPDVNADSKDKYGRTPLSWAAEKGHEAVVGLLLERSDVEPGSKDNYGHTPLGWASNGREDAVKNLLERHGSG